MNAEAESFFREMLEAPEGRAAREYLISRGIGPELWEEYGIGYAPASGEALLSSLSRHGVEWLLKLGLIVQAEKGYIDRFRDRVIFPIRDELGRTVAFAGRSLSGAEPKYLNSPNTPLFEKGTLLYGLDKAKEAMRRSGKAVLVEGYTDVISLHAAGIREAVSSMGTSLTEAQARRLSRFAKEVVIAYDADAAGEASTLRGIGVLLDAGLEVGVAVLPAGEDPDSLVRNQGVSAVRAFLSGAEPFQEFFLKALAERADIGTLRGKEEVFEGVRQLWGRIRSPVLRGEWAERIALLLGIPQEEVWKALQGKIGWRELAEEGPAYGPEEVVLKFLLSGKLDPERLSQLAPGDFSGEYREIVRVWLERWRAGLSVEPRHLASELGPEDQARLSRIVLWDITFTDEGKALDEAWRRFFVLPRIERRLRELREEMAAAERGGNGERLRALTEEYLDLCRGRARLLKGGDEQKSE